MKILNHCGAVALIVLHLCVCEVIIRDRAVFANHKAKFLCVTRDGSTNWTINDTSIDNLDTGPGDLVSHRRISAGFYILTLTVYARVEYNRTKILCVNSDEDIASAFLLYIQGIFPLVQNVTVEGNATSVTISWTAPFSLDVTDIDPDIWYSVLIHNVTDTINPTAIHCIDCTNITETHYTFTPDYPSPCHKYIFTIIPLNGVGHGEPSQNITGKTTGITSTCTSKKVTPSGETGTTGMTSSPDQDQDDGWSGVIVAGVAGFLLVSASLLVFFILMKKRKTICGEKVSRNVGDSVKQKAAVLMRVGEVKRLQDITSNLTDSREEHGLERKTEHKVQEDAQHRFMTPLPKHSSNTEGTQVVSGRHNTRQTGPESQFQRSVLPVEEKEEKCKISVATNTFEDMSSHKDVHCVPLLNDAEVEDPELQGLCVSNENRPKEESQGSVTVAGTKTFPRVFSWPNMGCCVNPPLLVPGGITDDAGSNVFFGASNLVTATQRKDDKVDGGKVFSWHEKDYNDCNMQVNIDVTKETSLEVTSNKDAPDDVKSRECSDVKSDEQGKDVLQSCTSTHQMTTRKVGNEVESSGPVGSEPITSSPQDMGVVATSGDHRRFNTSSGGRNPANVIAELRVDEPPLRKTTSHEEPHTINGVNPPSKRQLTADVIVPG